MTGCRVGDLGVRLAEEACERIWNEAAHEPGLPDDAELVTCSTTADPIGGSRLRLLYDDRLVLDL